MSSSRFWNRLLIYALTCGTGCAVVPVGQVEGQDDLQYERESMVEHQLASRDIVNDKVLKAMKEVPRHLFVPEVVKRLAYEDFPLPIGDGQTISQPYIVALMTQLAEPGPEDKVLEVGTGSGYQAAVLSRIVDEVFTIEIVPRLAEESGRLLARLGYDNVHVLCGDGYAGWPSEAPFDIVVITAAAPKVPEPLKAQLAEGGRIVMPLGEPDAVQQLVVYRMANGRLRSEHNIPVRFVPMVGQVQLP